MKTVFQNEDISKIIETREITAARKSVKWIHTNGVKHSNAHKQRWILVSD